MPADIYSNIENRRKVFSEFLEKHFNKKLDQINGDDLLSLIGEHFNSEINLSFGNASSLLGWYGKSKQRKLFKEKNVIFSIFDDLGYAKKFKITEEDCKLASREKIRSSRQIYKDKDVRLSVFNEFIQKHFNKKLDQINGEDFLSLRSYNFRSKTKLSFGSLNGLLQWYNHPSQKKLFKGKNRVFSILKDLDYAERFGITEQDCKSAAHKKLNLSRQIYNNKENREKVFNEFLKKRFGENHEITSEDLLFLRKKDFTSSKIKLPFGSTSGLAGWYYKCNNGKNAIFAILEDLDYAKEFNITEQDCKDAARRHNSEARRKRQIVIINPKIVGFGPHEEGIKIPDNVHVVPEGDQTQIQVVVSTQQRSSEKPQDYEKSSIPMMNQAISRVFGSIEIATDRSHEQIISCKNGNSIAIKSQYPLDEIYLKGLDKAGFKVSQKNIRLKTEDPYINSRLSQYVTVAQREKETQSDPSLNLAFKNDLDPEKTASHILGNCARMASKAQTREQLYFHIDEALDWLMFLKEASEKNPEHFKNLDFKKFSEEFLNGLARVDDSVMKRLNITNFKGVSLSDNMKKYLELRKKMNLKEFSSSVERKTVLSNK